MNEKKYIYVVGSDLDGTLLGKGEIISEENLAAIEEMERRGVCFVPNSGRCFSEMPKCVLENPHIRYYIGSDGASIWDKETGDKISFTMSREIARPMLDIIYRYKHHINVRHKGICYADSKKCGAEEYARYRLSKNYALFTDYYISKIEDFDKFIYELEDIEMICIFFSDDGEMAECKARIEELGEFVVASSEPTNIEVFHKSAGKGTALLKLAERLGVPQERTVAVGDGKNDMDMIRKAGISLAMGNAVPELKEAADRTICYCEEHSAKYILENITK